MLHQALSFKLLENLDVLWTFLLLLGRFAGMLAILPGIGMGVQGLKIRTPAALLLAYTVTISGPTAPLPGDWALLVGGFISEILLGFLLGVMPALVVAGLHMAGQMASTTMGLGAAQLIDPSSGMQVPSLGRIIGDVMICFFLLINGHHAVIYAVAGMGGEIIPGTFLITETSIEVLINQSANIFTIGLMVSAPVLVALLLTQFVMGLISKAVPQVNIFIVSFPLTIGIGLILSMLSLPEIVHYSERQYVASEQALAVVVTDVIQTGARPKEAVTVP